MSIEVGNIYLWGEKIGAVAWDDRTATGRFKYTPEFTKKGIEPAPITMRVKDNEPDGFVFPGLAKGAFSGLPGMLADSLPDKFGNKIIDNWLLNNGRTAGSMSPIEKLLYIGSRGMGALEFRPATRSGISKAQEVEIAELAKVSNAIVKNKESLDVNIQDNDAIFLIYQVGVSAGGARTKAIIAMNDHTGRVISGHGVVPDNYQHWIIKFDGVEDSEYGQSDGLGRVEYAYHLMAVDAGISMSECRLFEEHDRAHFITKRFDRIHNEKFHMQTLCGIAHMDLNDIGNYSYEQAFTVCRQINLPSSEMAELFRRMVFNVVARNHDDHTKNMGFVMGKDGSWKLSPAYDITYSYKLGGKWTNVHQMVLLTLFRVGLILLIGLG